MDVWYWGEVEWRGRKANGDGDNEGGQWRKKKKNECNETKEMYTFAAESKTKRSKEEEGWKEALHIFHAFSPLRAFSTCPLQFCSP